MPWKFVPTQREVILRLIQAIFILFVAGVMFRVCVYIYLYSMKSDVCSVIWLQVRIKPGESALAFYTAENKSSTPITGMSTYNVTPMKVWQISLLDYMLNLLYNLKRIKEKILFFQAGIYFNKIQCFCFEEQRLLPGETINMPVSTFLFSFRIICSYDLYTIIATFHS